MKPKPSFRVVLKVPDSYARASGVVFSWLAAGQLALDYWDNAVEGETICVYIPPESRGKPDYMWIVGIDDVAGIYKMREKK